MGYQFIKSIFRPKKLQKNQTEITSSRKFFKSSQKILTSPMGILSNKIFMSSTESIATPAIPTSPFTLG